LIIKWEEVKKKMKYKHIGIGLIALSLLAMAFVSTAVASELSAYMGASRQGNKITFSISAIANPGFPIDSIDITKITLVILPKDQTTTLTYEVPLDVVIRDANGITFTLDRRDLPVSKADDSWATGFLSNGDTFVAAGPGWGWGNIR
jgi:hypothetical protein